MSQSDQVVLTLRPAAGRWLAPPEVRLRRALKSLLRVFGFAVVRIDWPSEAPAANDTPVLAEKE